MCLFACLKKQRKDLQFEKARELLQDEIDLIKLIRQVRFLSAAVDCLISTDDAFKIRQQTKRHLIQKPEPSNGKEI